MTTPEIKRVLRIICIATLAVSMAFLIPFGVVSHNVVPPLCLIPGGFSALISLYHLTGFATHKAINVLLDVAICCYLLGMIVPATIVTARSWRGGGEIVLGAYGIMPLMLNFCLHAFLAIDEVGIWNILSYRASCFFQSPTCPHCQHKILSGWGMAEPVASSSHGSSSRGSYAGIMHDAETGEGQSQPRASIEEYKDNESRPSVDDETARLV